MPQNGKEPKFKVVIKKSIGNSYHAWKTEQRHTYDISIQYKKLYLRVFYYA